jgi:adenylate kinase family enzyme
MIVEFIGLPGSGKTTLRRQFLADLSPAQEARYLSEETALLVVARRRIDRVFRIPLKLLPHGLAMRFCPKVWWRSMQRSESLVRFLVKHGAALGAFTSSGVHDAMSEVDRFRVIESFLETGAVREFLDDPQMADRVVLFGEGLVQKSLMFVDHSDVIGETAEAARYLENIPLPDLVIHVRVSTDVSIERMTGRSDGLTQRLKKADSATIRRFVGKASHHLELLSGWFAKNHPDRMLTIDNHQSAASAAAAIRERLLTL